MMAGLTNQIWSFDDLSEAVTKVAPSILGHYTGLTGFDNNSAVALRLSTKESHPMPYQFPSDIQQSIQAQIASGEFESEDEVLRQAMATLESRQRGLQQLRQMVADADGDLAAGRVGPFDAQETKRSVRERLERQGIVD